MSSSGARIGAQFKTLDDYLAFLKRRNAPIDKPWYEEVRPGVYELQTGNLTVLGSEDANGASRKPTFTREELERKFGFRK